MRLNFVIPGIGLSGGMRVLFEYGERLTDRGHDVLFYLPITAFYVKQYKNPFRNIFHFFTRTLKNFFNYFILRKHKKVPYKVKIIIIPFVIKLFVRSSDLNIATAFPTAFSVSRISKRLRNGVYFIQDYEVWLNKKLADKSYLLPLKKIVISSWINDKLKSNLGIGPFPIVFDGIDLDKIGSNSERKYENLEQASILMLSHVLKKKGVEIGINAVNEVKKKYPFVTLTLFGLDKFCPYDNVDNYISDPDLPTLKQLYEKCDIFVFPPLEEGWGLTPLEAMACKCPVVGSNTGCLLDLGVDRKNVILCEPGNSDEIRDGIIELIENPSLYRSISIGGFNTVTKLSWDNSTIKLCGLLEDFINEER